MPKIIRIEHGGEERDLVGWAKWLGMPYESFHKRYQKYQVDGDKAKLFRKYKPYANREVKEKVDGDGKPIREADVLIEYRGVRKSLRVWCGELRLPVKAVVMRYRRGMRGESLLAPVRMYTYTTTAW